MTVRPPALHIQARRRLPSRTAILPLHALQIRARHLREARAAELCTFWRRSAAGTSFNVLSELASIADSLRLVQCATHYSPQPLITRMRLVSSLAPPSEQNTAQHNAMSTVIISRVLFVIAMLIIIIAISTTKPFLLKNR